MCAFDYAVVLGHEQQHAFGFAGWSDRMDTGRSLDPPGGSAYTRTLVLGTLAITACS
jgi:hypothetical protein